MKIKSFAREAPNEMTFTESEFQRLMKRKGKFLLIVVSGLEEGFKTKIRVYAALGTTTTAAIAEDNVPSTRHFHGRHFGILSRERPPCVHSELA